MVSNSMNSPMMDRYQRLNN